MKSNAGYEKLRKFLADGSLVIGDRLPGERELSQALDIGRSTLRTVLDQLESEGIVTRLPQSGTYLAVRPLPLVTGQHVTLIAPLQHAPGTDPATDTAWLHRVISAAERTIRPSGAKLTVLDQTSSAADRCSILELARQAVQLESNAAVLLHPAGSKQKIAMALSLLHDSGVHPVIVSARDYVGMASQVYFDSGWGAYLSTRHLLINGHVRLGFAGASIGHEWVRERLLGFQNAQTSAGLQPTETWQWLLSNGEAAPNEGDGIAAFERWLSLPENDRPTGIVAANDIVALGFLKSALAVGVRVPGDVSVVGFDNDVDALRHGLTTVERPEEALGEAIARVTLDRLSDGPQGAAVSMRLRPVLIERNTVARLRDTIATI